MRAARQTGRTSALLALHDLLNGGEEGEYRYAYINAESAQTARARVPATARKVLRALTGHTIQAILISCPVTAEGDTNHATEA